MYAASVPARSFQFTVIPVAVMAVAKVAAGVGEVGAVCGGVKVSMVFETGIVARVLVSVLLKLLLLATCWHFNSLVVAVAVWVAALIPQV